VKIKFSRHAKRRAKLYRIPESTILKILEGKEFHPGTHELMENAEGFKYPLKIVAHLGFVWNFGDIKIDIIGTLKGYNSFLPLEGGGLRWG